jgi:histidyl-tRNA synthetase
VAERLTDAQLRNQRAQALRALRRSERELDTHIEVIERKLDRAIENKEKITIRLALGLGDDARKLQNLGNKYLSDTADMIQIFLG